MTLTIFYLNEYLRYDNDEEKNVVTRYNYENGVREMTEEELIVEKHYTEVDSFEFENILNEDNNRLLYENDNELMNELFHTYNMGEKPRIITRKVQYGVLNNVGHSSMSVGDIIKIDEDVYIVEGLGFRKL